MNFVNYNQCLHGFCSSAPGTTVLGVAVWLSGTCALTSVLLADQYLQCDVANYCDRSVEDEVGSRKAKFYQHIAFKTTLKIDRFLADTTNKFILSVCCQRYNILDLKLSLLIPPVRISRLAASHYKITVCCLEHTTPHPFIAHCKR